MSEERAERDDAQEPRAPLPSGGGRSGISRDEDLFDFPAPGSSSTGESGDSQPSTLAQPAMFVDTASATQDPEESDFDLDEDLFNFAELFTVAESHAGDETVARAKAIRAEEVGTPVEGVSVEDVEPGEIGPVLAPQAAAQATSDEASEQTHTPAITEAEPELRRVRSVAPLYPTDLLGDPLPLPSSRKYLVEVLAAGFVLVNAFLIFFAWQATHSFQSAIEGIKGELTRPVEAGTGLPVSDPLVDPAPIVETTPDVTGPLISSQNAPKLDYHELELTLAKQEVGMGEFFEARIRLNRLLANQDRSPVGEKILESAEYLVAESYFLEARGLPKERP